LSTMRRAAGKIGPVPIAIGFASLLVLAIGTFYFFIRNVDDYRNLEKLDINSYANSATTFQGGTYKIEGNLEEVIGISTEKGKLVSLAVTSAQGVILIPVFIPEKMKTFNLEKGQRLQIKVKGVHRGLLEAEGIQKAS